MSVFLKWLFGSQPSTDVAPIVLVQSPAGTTPVAGNHGVVPVAASSPWPVLFPGFVSPRAAPPGGLLPLVDVQPPAAASPFPAAAANTFESLPKGLNDPFARPRHAGPPQDVLNAKLPPGARLIEPPPGATTEAQTPPAVTAPPPAPRPEELPRQNPAGDSELESLHPKPIDPREPRAERSVAVDDHRKTLILPKEVLWYALADGSKHSIEVPVAPWSAICYLEMARGQTTYHGTGWFIGPRTIMTAAHNLYLRDERRAVESVTIQAGATGPGGSPFGSVTTTDFHYDPRYATAADSDTIPYDYGVIFLPDERLGSFVRRYFNFSAQNPALDLGTIGVAGYPFDLGFHLVYANGNQTGGDPNIIIHDIDTEKGQSGAPIYHYNPATGYTVIGTHTDGFGIGHLDRNAGVRISPELYRRMEFWKSNPGVFDDPANPIVA